MRLVTSAPPFNLESAPPIITTEDSPTDTNSQVEKIKELESKVRELELKLESKVRELELKLTNTELKLELKIKDLESKHKLVDPQSKKE